MKLIQEEEAFVQKYIKYVVRDLQELYDVSQAEAHKLISGSAFLATMESYPEYVVNHDTEYWAESIYTSRAMYILNKNK